MFIGPEGSSGILHNLSVCRPDRPAAGNTFNLYLSFCDFRLGYKRIFGSDQSCTQEIVDWLRCYILYDVGFLLIHKQKKLLYEPDDSD